MKLPANEIDSIRTAINHIDTAELRRRYIAGDFPRSDRVKDLNKRYRWDLLSAVRSASDICKWYEDYEITDVHIDSALRSIVAPLESAK